MDKNVTLKVLEKYTMPQLVELIEQLIQTDFAKLVQLLYQIDVSEAKLKTMLQQNQATNAASIIAELIAARLLERAETKARYAQYFTKKDGIDEEERW